MEKQAVTIYDVAREAGVSMATVSRVVNGNANVKPATKEKVQAVIDKLNYRPNAIARGLASRKTTTVGLVVPDITNQYFAELARGIDDVAKMYNYQIILAGADESNQEGAEVLDNLLGKQVDGIIFIGNQLSDKVRERLASVDMPTVFAGSIDRQGTDPSVNINYQQAFKEATDILVKHGHQRIAFISGSLNHVINQEHKLAGYQQALVDAGLPLDKALVFQGDYSYQSGYAMTNQLRAIKATAAIVVNDEMAAGLLNGLTDSGVQVPADFEVITSNSSKLTEMTRPQLSTITQPIYDIGAVSMRALTKLLAQEPLDDDQVTLAHGFSKRGTTR